jgi:prepilin-type N-terminal cleavage/methylation domain-containing protein
VSALRTPDSGEPFFGTRAPRNVPVAPGRSPGIAADSRGLGGWGNRAARGTRAAIRLGMRRPREAGFTLIEMGIVVAVISVLASVAIPQFMTDKNGGESDAEVSAMFTALSIAEAQYKLENGVYFSTGGSESTTFPATPGKAPQSLTPPPATWAALKVTPPSVTAYCGYVVIAGAANQAPGAMASTKFGFTAPKQPYFYILAHCNMDGDASADAYYFQSSVSSTIKSFNVGD